MTCFRPEDAVDSSMVITCSRQFVLEVGNFCCNGGPIVRTVAVPTIVRRIVAALIVVGGIVPVLVAVIGAAVSAGIISISGAIRIPISIAVSVGIPVRIVIVRVVIEVGPAEPREEPEIEDEPGTIHETATVPIPKMVVPAVPIAIPIGRALSEDVIMSGSDVANCPVPAAGPELRSPIAILALQFSESIGSERSVVLQTRKIIASPPSERSRRKLAVNNRSISARIESRSLTEGRGHRTRAHRGEPL